MALRLTDPISGRDRGLVLAACTGGAVGLILLGRYLGPSIPLTALFFLPLLVAAAFVPRWAIFLCGIGLALLQEYWGPFTSHEAAPTRLALSMLAFTGGALFAGELVRNRRVATELLVKTQRSLDVERELRVLLETSPAAVLTLDSEARIAMANEAARRLLGFGENSPEGEPIEAYIPLLASLCRSEQAIPLVRTMVEAKGRRRTGENFYAQIWVSAYNDVSGPRLAAIVADATEQLRDREESGLRELLSNSKIIACAVSHEIRNLIGAAAVLHHNLSESLGVRGGKDFEALGTVIESVLRISSGELDQDAEDMASGADIRDVLDDLRMILMPSFEEDGICLNFEIGEELPAVRGNPSGLLQVFINLARNSQKAVGNGSNGRLRITAYRLSDSVVVRFADNGPGISPSTRLFQPFQAGASSTGLGLFVSRAIVRTFGGDLHHTQRAGECCFVVELPLLVKEEMASA